MVADRTVVVLAGLGVAAVAGVAYFRWRAEQQRAAEEAAKDPCELLRLAGRSEAEIAACKIGKVIGGEILDVINVGLDGIITGQVGDFRKQNEKVNGKVTEENPLDIDDRFFSLNQGWPWYVQQMGPDSVTKIYSVSMMRGRPPLHENGCIPAPGAWLSDGQGWHRCAEGTASYVRTDEAQPIQEGSNRWNNSSYKATATGRYITPRFLKSNASTDGTPDAFKQILDPTTHYHFWQGGTSGSRKRQEFPLVVPEGGAAWWVVGKPYVSPEKAKIPLVEWQTIGGRRRVKSVSFVAEQVEPPQPPPAMPPSGNPPIGIPESPPTDSPGPGYTWETRDDRARSLPPPGGYWRRLRANEVVP